MHGTMNIKKIHVTPMGIKLKICLEKLMERNSLRDLEINGKI